MPDTPRKGRLVISLNRKKCPWLRHGRYLEKGRLVYLLETVQCVAPDVIAVTNEPGKFPFFEIPKDAVEWIG